MKNLLSIILLFSPIVLLSQTIVSTSPENKNAIVEESTGIHCSYCPEGHAILNQVVEQNPNDVFVIKFHEGGYAWDCDPNGGHDFNNDIANQLGVMGQATGQPSASVNRKVFPSYSMTGSSTAMSRGAWAAAINSVLSESSYVNVGVEASIDGNELTVHVELYYTSDSPISSNFINIAILQSETVGPQLGTEFNPDYRASNAPNPAYQHGEYDYRHMNRLVDMINGISGDLVSETSQGSFVDRTYTYTMPTYYNDVPVDLSEIEVVAFVTSGNEIINGSGADAQYALPPYDLSLESVDSPSGIGSFSNSESIIVSISNEGENDITGFDISYQINGGNLITENYSGTIASGSTIQYTFNSTYDFSQAGDYTIVATVSAENDENGNNDSSSASITTFICPDLYSLPYINDFNDAESFNSCNTFVDSDGDSSGWTRVAFSIDNGNYVADSQSYNGAVLFPDNWIVMGPIDLSNVSSASLSWLVRGIDPSWCQENYSVYISDSNDINSLVSSGLFYNETIASGSDACGNSFAQRDLDISSASGQIIYVGFRHHDVSDMFRLNIDDVRVESDNLGIIDNNSLKTNLYPNPTDQNYVTIETTVSGIKEIEVFDLLGKMIIDVSLSSNQLDISQLDSGVYMVRVAIENQSSTTKLIVE